MPWGTKKEEIPDELKDLGLTPAQIREAVLNNKKLTEDLANSKTEVSSVKSEFEKLKGSYGETKTKLDELEANSRRQPVKKEEKTYTSFIDDENTAFTERLVDGIQPVAQVALQAAANSAMLLAKQSLQGQSIKTPGGSISLARLWDKWWSEIDKAALEVGLAAKGNMQTWLNLFDYIKGKHMNDLLAEPQTFVESVSTNQDKGPGDKKEPEKLTTMEEEIIKKQSRYGKGVTPEAYQKQKDKMTFVNV